MVANREGGIAQQVHGGVVPDGEQPRIEATPLVIAADLTNHVQPGLLEEVGGDGRVAPGAAGNGRGDAGTVRRRTPAPLGRAAGAERLRPVPPSPPQVPPRKSEPHSVYGRGGGKDAVWGGPSFFVACGLLWPAGAGAPSQRC